MSRHKKYATIEEKKAAGNINAKNWYQKHKNDPEFIKRRKWYQAKYYSKMNVDKKDFLREYNTDYAYYIKSVRTGKLEKKIIKSKQKVYDLQASIEEMEHRLEDLTKRFGHLENKNIEVKNDK